MSVLNWICKVLSKIEQYDICKLNPYKQIAKLTTYINYINYITYMDPYTPLWSLCHTTMRWLAMVPNVPKIKIHEDIITDEHGIKLV